MDKGLKRHVFPSLWLSTCWAVPAIPAYQPKSRARESPQRFRNDSCTDARFKLEKAQVWPQLPFR